jgi:methylase of polypeptide subunit release factors
MLPTFASDPSACAAALARLAAIGFSEQGVRERLGLADLADFQMKARAIYRQQRLSAGEPLDLAIELFVLQGVLTPAELERLFPEGEQQALVAAGMLAVGTDVRALASLYPVGRQLIFSDHGWPELAPGGKPIVPYDQVMYVGTDSRWLARATVRKPVDSALDLCTGSGIHALLAAGHARQVTAVDINPRAVRCTAFNARALGLGQLEALQGDLYGPVAGRQFELITANPPFVPAPAQEVGFRDGGPSGEDVQARILAGLPEHLAPGGIAQVVTEFGEKAGESLEPRLRRMLGGAPMDIQVLRLRTTAATAYAIGHADGEDGPAILEAVGRWGGNLQAQGYEQVVSVLLAFQWSQGLPWYRVDEADAPRREAGAEIEAAFAMERLARDPALEERLLQGRFQRTGPVLLLQASALGAPTPVSCRARQAGLAMAIEYPLEPLEQALLAGLDEPVVTAEVLLAAAKAGVAAAAILAALVSLVRKGLVRPV